MVAGGMDNLTKFRDHLIGLVDLLPEESAKLMDERPRFSHSVLVLADQSLPGEVLKANYIKQLDPYWIQTKGSRIGQDTQPTQIFGQQSLTLQTNEIHDENTSSNWSDSQTTKNVTPTPQFVPKPSSETSGIGSGGEESHSPLIHKQKGDKDFEDRNKSKLEHEELLQSQRNVLIVRETSDNREWHNQKSPVEEKRGFEDRPGLLGQALRNVTHQQGQPQNPLVKESFTKYVHQEHIKEHLPPVPPAHRQNEQHRNSGGVRHQEIVKSNYQRNQLDGTPFPSQDRLKLIRYSSDTEEHHLSTHGRNRRVEQKASTTNYDDPIIREAIRILEASCVMLDETAKRIAQCQPARNTRESLSFRFPSEVRRNYSQRNSPSSPPPYATSTTTTTTKLIKETLTTRDF